jgi:hypothetical protein
VKGGGSFRPNPASLAARNSIPNRQPRRLNRNMSDWDIMQLVSQQMAQSPVQQPTGNTKVSLWDQAVAKARVYTPPELKPATVENTSELVGQMVVFVKVVREAQSQYGRSALMGIIVNGREQTDTLWLNQNTVLYKQVLDEMKGGPFVAMIGEQESVAHPGQTYYTLIDPNNPSAVESRVKSELDDIPF